MHSKRLRIFTLATLILGLVLGIAILGGSVLSVTPASAKHPGGKGHGHPGGNGTTKTVTLTNTVTYTNTVPVVVPPTLQCGTAPTQARLTFGAFGPATFVVVCAGLKPNQTYVLSSNLPAGCVATAGNTTVVTDSAGNLTQVITVQGTGNIPNCQQGTFNFAFTSNNNNAPNNPTQTVNFSEVFTV